MQTLTAEELRASLDWVSVADALDVMFRSGCEMPVRHHHTVTVPGSDPATLLLMPAWTPGAFLGVKVVNIFPGNTRAGRPAVNGQYLLFSAVDGTLLSVMDGGELTARRTAAASLLAARYLARPNVRRILVVGTGRMGGNLAQAYSAAYPAAQIAIWGRDRGKVQAMTASLKAVGVAATVAGELSAAVADADIVSCATLSHEPLIDGAWLKAGTHLDLVGGFTPTMREADDEAVRRASVFVDTRAGATKEAGDIVIPLNNGALSPDRILADLHELARHDHPGRQRADEVTLFKSVGAALEDLAAAALAYQRRATHR